MRNPIALAGALLAALALWTAAPAFADGPGGAGPNVAQPPAHPAAAQHAPAAQPSSAPATTITGQSGQLTLMGGEINLNVPTAYRFYPAETALAYLQRHNATAPSGTVIGLIAPAGADLTKPDTWATTLSYDAVGYVRPETATGLNDTNLLASVQGARQDQGRRFEGFAIDPVFDPTAANVTWAERTGAPGAQVGGDFRHEARVLGRNGVAGLTSLGSADQQPDIVAALPTMLGMLSFPESRRYADYVSGDRVSNYTIPALVTGVPPVAPEPLVNQGVDTSQTSVGGLAGAFPWIAGGVIVLAAAGYLMMRRRRDPDEMEPEAEEA